MTPSGLRRATTALVAVALACVGCASPQRAPRSHSPAAEAIAHRTVDAGPVDARAAAVIDAVQREAATMGAALTSDAGLHETAREVLQRVRASRAQRAPGARVIQAIAWRAGVNDPIPAIVVMRRSPGAWSDGARDGLRSLVRADAPTHIGAAVTDVDGDELVVLALTQRRASLAPTPRVVSLGHALRVQGALLDGVRAPALMLTSPDGSTRERPLGPGPSIDATVPLDLRGVWQIELLATSAQGPTVVANFPVYVDVSPPPVPEVTEPAPAGSPASVAAELRALLDDARRAAGVPPLARLDLLDRVAQAHADDMSAHRFVAHVSPTTGGHADRLRAAGFVAATALENVARGYDAREIHDGLPSSPGPRANLLHAGVTHVGVGVAREADGPAWLVTQLFAEVTPALDTAASAERLLSGVNELRRARGLPELRSHPALVAAARSAASRYFSEPRSDQQAILQEAARAAQAASGTFRRVTVAGAFGPGINGAEQSASLMDPELRALGIGVAQGDRPHQPSGSVLVVFVGAVPR